MKTLQSIALSLSAALGIVAGASGAESLPLGTSPSSSKKAPAAESSEVISNRWQATPLPQLKQAAEQGDATAEHYLGFLLLNGHLVPKDLAEGVKWTQRAADSGLAASQTRMGYLYQIGLGVPRDRKQAETWYHKAAEQNFPDAQFRLGNLAEFQGQLQGSEIVGNHAVAAEWFEKAAAQGHVQAMVSLGNLYYYGKLERNYQLAAKWFRLAAEKGNSEAAAHLGELCYGNPKEHVEAARWLRVAAEHGDADSQFLLSQLLLKGEGVAHDPDEAQKWLRKAAANGNTQARDMLPATGSGSLSPDFARASRAELEQLVQDGYKEATLVLARDYEEGRSGPRDLYHAAALYWMNVLVVNIPQRDRDQAAEHLLRLYLQGSLKYLEPTQRDALKPAGQRLPFYYRFLPQKPGDLEYFLYHAAEQSSAGSQQFQIGEVFYRGEVLPENWQLAADCFKLAAKAGSLEAINRLGEMWAAGADGEPDFKEASRWYRRAAFKGLSDAQCNLGRAYLKGQGVDTNSVEAWAWLQLASERGCKNAGPDLAQLSSQLAPQALEQAKHLANEYRQQIKASPPGR